MKHLALKTRHLANGNEFITSQDDDDSIYRLKPFKSGWFEIYKDGAKQHYVLVRFFDDRLISFSRYKNGCINSVHIDNVHILDESNFVDEFDDEDYFASFDGEDVNLTGGELPKPVQLFIEHSLF